MPRLISFQFASPDEETRFFDLLNGIETETKKFERVTRKGLVDKGVFQIADVSGFTAQLRATLAELETLVRD